jgi:uncharacterized protein with HEPN domain
MLDEFLYLRDIVEASDDIMEFVDGVSKEDFLDSKLIRWAVVQRLGVIGEGSVKISAGIKSKHPSVDWGQIIGARNILIHTYFKIDWEIIWNTVQNDIPDLRRQVLKIIEEDFADRLEKLRN